MSLLPSKSDCVYTKCYCEENVWNLCKYIKDHGRKEDLGDVYAVFISNPSKTVPIWRQQSSTRQDTMVLWDYHVILLCQSASTVYDLDSLLDFPCTLEEYLAGALKCDWVFKPQFCRYLRVVPAMKFLELFSSDRSHMIKDDGTWRSTPPNYPPIQTKCSNSNNIDIYINMTENICSAEYGTVYQLNEFAKNFLCSKKN